MASIPRTKHIESSSIIAEKFVLLVLIGKLLMYSQGRTDSGHWVVVDRGNKRCRNDLAIIVQRFLDLPGVEEIVSSFLEKLSDRSQSNILEERSLNSQNSVVHRK